MDTLTREPPRSRPTPRKLGPAPRLSANARDEYHRQLDLLVSLDKLEVLDRDFLEAAFYAYSDASAKDFYPSQATMADLRLCSVRTVQRRIAGAKAAGVLLVAQLKGLDQSTHTWFCSSNTHRVAFVPEWIERQLAARAAKRAAERDARVQARAQAPRGRFRGRPDETRPPVPEFDPVEYELVRSEALPPAAQAARARQARDILLARPPPS